MRRGLIMVILQPAASVRNQSLRRHELKSGAPLPTVRDRDLVMAGILQGENANGFGKTGRLQARDL
jgi:hypothetical protein